MSTDEATASPRDQPADSSAQSSTMHGTVVVDMGTGVSAGRTAFSCAMRHLSGHPLPSFCKLAVRQGRVCWGGEPAGLFPECRWAARGQAPGGQRHTGGGRGPWSPSGQGCAVLSPPAHPERMRCPPIVLQSACSRSSLQIHVHGLHSSHPHSRSSRLGGWKASDAD